MSNRYLKLFADNLDKRRTFPSPIEPASDENGVEWKLRYAPESLTREDHMYLASIVSAYAYLVFEMTSKDRQAVVSEIRRLVDPRRSAVPALSEETSLMTTQFPVPGENFIDRTGAVRGVTKVNITDCAITVDYLEGESEFYGPLFSHDLTSEPA